MVICVKISIFLRGHVNSHICFFKMFYAFLSHTVLFSSSFSPLACCSCFLFCFLKVEIAIHRNKLEGTIPEAYIDGWHSIGTFGCSYIFVFFFLSVFFLIVSYFILLPLLLFCLFSITYFYINIVLLKKLKTKTH